MKIFSPKSELEQALVDTKSGCRPVTELLNLFLATRIAVSSAGKVAANGTGFQPLEFTKETVQMLGCFTTSERIGEFSSTTLFYLEMTGRQLLERLPPEYGLVINPGWSVGFDISPQGVAEILKDF